MSTHAGPIEHSEQLDSQLLDQPEIELIQRGNGNRRCRDLVSEDSIARAFTNRYADELRFDHNAGRWYKWTGHCWKRNETSLALHFCRELAVREGDGETRFARASVARGVETFARADPLHAVTSNAWNKDPFKLGTSAGTIHLRTGSLSPPKRRDMITLLAGVEPESGDPVRWLQFLSEATGDDPNLIRFLQQIAGYCLTGDTREQALFFIYGPGGTGKSVFLNMLNHMLGDYARTAAIDTFTASRNDRHPTDLAMLSGARLVSAAETEDSRAWAESRIKQMTGGDRIAARFMRQDFFEFIPQFKLVIVGNHAPTLRNVDEAMRRRINIIPFAKQPEEQDLQLEQKLKKEAGRILGWAIRGCQDWLKHGLVRPEIVLNATADYFDGQNVFGQWVGERCEQAPQMIERPTALFRDWTEFALAAGDEPGSQKRMAGLLGRAGFLKIKRGGSRYWQGLRLRQSASNTSEKSGVDGADCGAFPK